MGEQVMREKDGLRALKMVIKRQDGAGGQLRLRGREERTGKGAERLRCPRAAAACRSRSTREWLRTQGPFPGGSCVPELLGDPDVRVYGGADGVDRDELVGLVRLGVVAGADHDARDRARGVGREVIE